MLQLLLILFPLVIVDAADPPLFAMLLFAAGAKRSVANSAYMLIGHTLAYFAAGILVALGFERLADRFANPLPIDFILGGLIGIGLLWMAFATKKHGAATTNKPPWHLTPLRCLGFGAIISFARAPFALPYLAAVDQILKADLTSSDSLVALGVYNIAYALPFSLVPITVAMFGDAARSRLEGMNAVLARMAGAAMPWLLGVLGVVLVADSASYFLRGEGLW